MCGWSPRVTTRPPPGQRNSCVRLRHMISAQEPGFGPTWRGVADGHDAATRKVSFSALDPAPEAPGIASETTEIGGNRWARVRYEPDVLREEWCDEGHEGFVLEGDITYEFEDGTESLQLVAGEAFSLPGARVHRGTAGAQGALLFIIDREPEYAAPAPEGTEQRPCGAPLSEAGWCVAGPDCPPRADVGERRRGTRPAQCGVYPRCARRCSRGSAHWRSRGCAASTRG